MVDDYYQAYSTIIVSNQKTKTVTDASSSLTISDYNLSVSLVDSYSVLCKTNRVLDQLNLPMTAGQLGSKISVASAGDTEIIHILVIDQDPVLAQNIANTLSRVFQNEVVDIMKMDNVQIIDEAQIHRGSVGPDRIKYVMMGFAAGLVLGIAPAFLLEYLDRPVKTEEQVAAILGIPVLGSIPRAGKVLYNYFGENRYRSYGKSNIVCSECFFKKNENIDQRIEQQFDF